MTSRSKRRPTTRPTWVRLEKQARIRVENILMNERRTLTAGVIGGLVHAVVVGGLYVYLHGPELFGYSTATNSLGPFEPFTLYVIGGAFVLGVVPAVLLVDRRLVTPSLAIIAIVAGILLLSPRGLQRRPRAAGPPDFAFYFIWWFAPLFVASLAGGIEYGARRLLRDELPARSTGHS